MKEAKDLKRKPARISRKLGVAAATAGLAVGAGVVAPAPADAQQCTVTVITTAGARYPFHANVSPGTPVSAIPIPYGLLPRNAHLAREVETCAAPTTASTTSTTSSTSSGSSTSSQSSTSSTSSSFTTTSSTSSRSTSSSSGHPKGHSHGSPPHNHSSRPPTHRSKPASKPHGHAHKQKTSHSTSTTTTTTTSASTSSITVSTASSSFTTGSTSPFSLSLPGAAPLGVPNFFIDSFQIPPFLLPIYQAAGIQYDVPWQVLAAINEIETDYGRNLSVSSAGAVGWMQFLPSTWKEYGVDANGDGVADPYNPVDAIFTAARYLHAAGASSSLQNAIYAYNHASWYVQSVLLRAQLISAIPNPLISALTGLVEGHFPVAANSEYADGGVEQLAKTTVKGPNAAIPISSDPNAKSTTISAKSGSPVVAVNDGRIVKVGDSAALGRYVELQDATGNVYTYAHLGSITKLYPVPKPVRMSAAQIVKEFAASATPASPKSPATAGAQPSPATATSTSTNATASTAPTAGSGASDPAPVTIPAPMVKERLFADPSRPASYAAGGAQQIKAAPPTIANFDSYFSDVLHLGKNQYTLAPLKAGSIVVAGTILGRIASSPASAASASTSASGKPASQPSAQMMFMIRPAGNKAPAIDPKPILDGWKLLQATDVYRPSGIAPFVGRGSPTIGQILLMSKEQLETRVLSDPHVQIYPCGRRDIEAGLIDRRVLAVIEFLSASGLAPDVTGLECGYTVNGANGVDPAGATGASVDISKINGIPIAGHQGTGSITDVTIRRLLTLQGAMAPDEIISTMSYKGQSSTLSLSNHANRIEISYTSAYGTNKTLSTQAKALLAPGQWTALIARLNQIPEPVVPIAPSRYAIRTTAP